MIKRLNIPDQGHGVDVIALVDQMLKAAVERRASDIHIEPTADGAEVRLRIDGLLETYSHHESAVGRSVVTRLMVMAHLLTYRLDIPQEGRATVAVSALPRPMDVRLSIMPTTHGLRAAVRLPAELVQPHRLNELSLPANVMAGLERF